MSQMLKIPTPLHTQLKALASKRGTSMVAVIHDFVRKAIEAGELDDEVPGFRVRLELNLDTEGHGPFVILSTPEGDLPPMTRQTAEHYSDILAQIAPGDDTEARSISDRTGHWAATNVGTGIKLYGGLNNPKTRLEGVVTVAFARDLARQLRAVAGSAVADAA